MSWDIPNTRKEFYESWIKEAPYGANPQPGALDRLITQLTEFSEFYEPIDVGNGYKKSEGESVVYYWYENRGEILAASELMKRPSALVVNLTGKRYKGIPPYMIDLYTAVLNDQPKPIRLLSDKSLSDDGLNMWRGFVSRGYHIGVYDNSRDNRVVEKIKSVEEFDSFFNKTDTSFGRYQYILGEGVKVMEAGCQFRLRRYWELSGTTEDDMNSL